MPRKRRREKIVDKWKQKQWYTLLAPPMFAEQVLGTTPVDDPSKLIGRIIETTLFDLSGSFDQIHVKLNFEVYDVVGNIAKTRFVGHNFARDYLRALIRRKSTRLDRIFNVTTKDGYKLRLSVIALTTHRCQNSHQRQIREVMEEVVQRKAKELSFQDLVQQAVLGKIAGEIHGQSRKIFPLRSVEVRKSKLLSMPKVKEEKEAAVPAVPAQPIEEVPVEEEKIEEVPVEEEETEEETIETTTTTWKID
ncbi:MAG: 30S ribosomal protein S3ae [Asgard group archaeon]